MGKLSKKISEKIFIQDVENKLNVDITPEYRFHPKRRWRFDFAIPDYLIAIEVEGGVWVRGRHTRGSGFIKDMEKYNAAASLGWLVLKAIPSEINSVDFLRLVEKTLTYRKKCEIF